jgi:uncharacterized protein (TIGR03437 family)
MRQPARFAVIFCEYSNMRARLLLLCGCTLVFSLAANAQMPVVSTGGVVSAAGLGNTTSIAPGSLISIFGTNLASGLAQASSATLSTSLGDVNSVMINGVAAPLQFVAGGQINAQAPWALNAGQAMVVVTRAGVASAPVTAQVSQFAPALYGFNLGTPQAIAINNSDGSVVAPSASIPGITTHPAMSGDAIIFYASGLGPVNNTPSDGSPAVDGTHTTISPLTAMIGGAPAQVVFSGLAPQYTGVYQVNLVVPANVTTGSSVPVQLLIGGVMNVDMLTIALQ